MPGSSFGDYMSDWVRLALTIEDAALEKAVERICAFAHLRAAAE